MNSAKIDGQLFSEEDDIILDELVKCYNCNCEKYPFCNINGFICTVCIDNNHHFSPDFNNLGYFRKDTNDIVSIFKNLDKHEDKHEDNEFSIVTIPPNGDCLFNSVSKAFHNYVTVSNLRHVVACKQTPETYKAYKASQEDDELKFMNSINSLEEFRAFIKKGGKNHGAQNCFWGDENAINILSNEFKVTFVILDKDGSHKSSISPSIPLDNMYYIFLLHSDNSHYDLLKFNNCTVVNSDTWETIKTIYNA